MAYAPLSNHSELPQAKVPTLPASTTGFVPGGDSDPHLHMRDFDPSLDLGR